MLLASAIEFTFEQDKMKAPHGLVRRQASGDTFHSATTRRSGALQPQKHGEPTVTDRFRIKSWSSRMLGSRSQAPVSNGQRTGNNSRGVKAVDKAAQSADGINPRPCLEHQRVLKDQGISSLFYCASQRAYTPDYGT